MCEVAFDFQISHTTILKMKNESPICSILGLTQRDAAMVMHVHTSQWSMFESGKRSLPVHAAELLATLLEAANTPSQSAKALQKSRHLDRQAKLLYSLLLENAYQLETVKREIEALIPVHEVNIRRQRVADCLYEQSAAGKVADPLAKYVSIKAEKALGIFDKRLFKMEIKQEILLFEKQLLESKLDKLGSGAEDDTESGDLL